MMKWGRVLIKTFLALLLITATLVAIAYWMGNRTVEPVSRQEIDQRFDRAMGWMRQNEAYVLSQQNSALWWMVQAAAQRTGDPYLTELVQRSLAIAYGDTTPSLVWKRMIDPKAQVQAFDDIDPLHPYQRFFLHALTCTPVQRPDFDSNDFLAGRVCPALLNTVLVNDPACTTHHLMGLDLFRQTGCQPPHDLAPLRETLYADIERELTFDVVMKDAYIQRVLMLVWDGQQARVKPVWLRRALEAQEPGGHWLGHRRLPEFPEKLQPWYWREWLSTYFPKRLPAQRVPQDFHATAQGLLLLALLKSEQPPSASAPAAKGPGF